MKLMVGGYARHGKDQFCEYLGMKFTSSSMVALEEVVWPATHWERGSDGKCWKYNDKKECFEDRCNRRKYWHRLIKRYNHNDPTRLARIVYENNDVYCGIRDRDEFLTAKAQGMFDLSIWIDAGERAEPEGEESCTILKSDFDVIITNNGTLEELKHKAETLAKALGQVPQPLESLVVEWADSVFPDRTITNAIQKMVLEEIPEYLLSQSDPMELADLGILLYDISHLAGVDLDKAIRAKMEINKKRTWHLNETTGLMSHDI